MPVSIIILGVLIILNTLSIGESIRDEFRVNPVVLNAIFLVIFGLLFIIPINIDDIIYFSIGGFIVVTIFTMYLLFQTRNKEELGGIALGVMVVIATLFLLNIFFPFMQEQLFDYTTAIVGVILGLVTFIAVKNAKNIFIILFLGTPISAIINFILIRPNSSAHMLFLGNGNFFEIAMMAFATGCVFMAFKNMYDKSNIKTPDILTVNKEEIKVIKEEKEKENEK
jgi:hypothetical protein